MERRGTKLGPESGVHVAALMGSGFELDFMAKPADPPIVMEGEVFLTQCLLLAIPVRSPANKLKSPVQGECHATTPLVLLQKEIELGRCDMRDAYAEKCAQTIYKMLGHRAPGSVIGVG